MSEIVFVLTQYIFLPASLIVLAIRGRKLLTSERKGDLLVGLVACLTIAAVFAGYILTLFAECFGNGVGVAFGLTAFVVLSAGYIQAARRPK